MNNNYEVASLYYGNTVFGRNPDIDGPTEYARDFIDEENEVEQYEYVFSPEVDENIKRGKRLVEKVIDKGLSFEDLPEIVNLGVKAAVYINEFDVKRAYKAKKEEEVKSKITLVNTKINELLSKEYDVQLDWNNPDVDLEVTKWLIQAERNNLNELSLLLLNKLFELHDVEIKLNKESYAKI